MLIKIIVLIKKFYNRQIIDQGLTSLVQDVTMKQDSYETTKKNGKLFFHFMKKRVFDKIYKG